MKRNRINVPLPTGGANTQDATALGGASREQNVLLRDTKGRLDMVRCPPFQARGLFPPSFWGVSLRTKQLAEISCHKGHSPLKGLTELTCEFLSSLTHSFICSLNVQ